MAKRVGVLAACVACSGKRKHATRCADGAECLVFIDSAGAWDVVLDEAGKAAPAR